MKLLLSRCHRVSPVAVNFPLFGPVAVNFVLVALVADALPQSAKSGNTKFGSRWSENIQFQLRQSGNTKTWSQSSHHKRTASNRGLLVKCSFFSHWFCLTGLKLNTVQSSRTARADDEAKFREIIKTAHHKVNWFSFSDSDNGIQTNTTSFFGPIEQSHLKSNKRWVIHC